MKNDIAMGLVCPMMSKPVATEQGFSYMHVEYCKGQACSVWREYDMQPVDGDTHQGECGLIVRSDA